MTQIFLMYLPQRKVRKNTTDPSFTIEMNLNEYRLQWQIKLHENRTLSLREKCHLAENTQNESSRTRQSVLYICHTPINSCNATADLETKYSGVHTLPSY